MTKFEEWFEGLNAASGGKLPHDEESYRRFMRISWLSCRQEVLKILNDNYKFDLQNAKDVWVDGKHIKECKGWIEPRVIQEIEKL